MNNLNEINYGQVLKNLKRMAANIETLRGETVSLQREKAFTLQLRLHKLLDYIESL